MESLEEAEAEAQFSRRSSAAIERSLSFDNAAPSPKPQWLESTPYKPIVSNFDPKILPNFRKALSELSPQHQTLLKSPEPTKQPSSIVMGAADNVVKLLISSIPEAPSNEDAVKLGLAVLSAFKEFPCCKTNMRMAAETYKSYGIIFVSWIGVLLRVVDSGVGVMVAEAEEDEVEGELVLKAGVVVEEDAVLVEVVVEEGVVEVAVVAVEPHRHDGVFVAKGKEDALCTKNMVVGESVYGEKRVAVQVFKRILKAYATKLYSRLPKGGSGLVAAATGTNGQIKVI
ncbi:uncharacterized protein A4U43_C01F700 [Asparagus officinalis]|uniref:Uncharacterized protein n=1 Tax=Asparagus officinalis TaxID=4686 RepID=A0A5P1FQE7_ASPOF|nr:uncharacterized protein A4U43_C01F700 [Asparagus officinalis]